jgi:DNA polymerase III subunit delta'|tara:strand:- start:5312 stop:6244 length:933 start_codon:yes stop_codon:yes gene_type:complete
MNELKPYNQQKLFGLDKHLLELIRLYKINKYPNKLLLSGQKGIGKSTLAYHFINYILSENETHKYDIKSFEINSNSPTFKTILNKSNTNVINVDISAEKKTIDINQIRDLVVNLNKSSFNNNPRFILIDNIEFLNTNSVNALLKVLEEPNHNIHFILINNNKKILPTLLSRCINYKIYLTNNESLKIIKHLLGVDLNNLINKDLIDYYITPGYIYNLVKSAQQYKYNLLEIDLQKMLKVLIVENHYKKDPFIKYVIFNLVELYFKKLNFSFSQKLAEKYSYFIRRISDTKNFNLDEESLFMEFEEKILNE